MTPQVSFNHKYQTLWVNENDIHTIVSMTGYALMALVGTEGVYRVESHFSDDIKVTYNDGRVQVFEYYLPWIVSEGVGR